jgi:Na+/phosphate symporter
MRPFAYLISGIGILVLLPFAALMTAFAHGPPHPTPLLSLAQGLAVVTLALMPIAWLGSVLAALVTRQIPPQPIEANGAIADDAQLLEHFRTHTAATRKREEFLNRCATVPYLAVLAHGISWIFLTIVMSPQ